MTYGLGAKPSPPDERDYPLAQLAAEKGLILAAASLPASYDVKVAPPVYDQGDSPMCVAYSDACEQGSFDLSDQHHNYKWDFAGFFKKIGGGPDGAYVRNALRERLKVGYPLLPKGSGNSASSHRISAYYAVPKTRQDICAAIKSFGVVIIVVPWYHSWFDPMADGTLPSADYLVGYHAICAKGWTPAGVKLRNSWGATWGKNGECLMPWSTLLHVIVEAWKAVDVIENPIG